ncbi:MAG: Gfo/Idh/MocA family oxidoreductase [Clostridia bacterium]|nr:Gfo/Idh/MocA family oxidoreductase [Clostridia bacterium]
MGSILKVGVIGLGGRGHGLMRGELLPRKDVEVVHVCDLFPDRAKAGADSVEELRGVRPKQTTDYRNVINDPDVEAVFIYTAWEQHIGIAVAALDAGKHTAVEVGGAYGIKDCWELVDAAERSKATFMFLENCCYDRSELMVFNMVKQGLFGEIVHAAGAYGHDLRDEIAFGAKNRHYRLRNYICRNCENYPTHDLGPIAKIMRINRGNLMLRLNSVASRSAGLHEFVRAKMPGSPLENTVFAQGDTVDTVITCADGSTIHLMLQTTLPRYYSRNFTICGTKGMFSEENDCVMLDGITPEDGNLRGNASSFHEKYDSPLWNDPEELKKHGHGGMDCLTHAAAVETFLAGTPSPIDVYDAAAWMSISCLSEQSIRLLGAPVEIPDFTRGRWRKRADRAEGIFALEMD